jgi:hypothetical protein
MERQHRIPLARLARAKNLLYDRASEAVADESWEVTVNTASEMLTQRLLALAVACAAMCSVTCVQQGCQIGFHLGLPAENALQTPMCLAHESSRDVEGRTMEDRSAQTFDMHAAFIVSVLWAKG